MLVKQFSKFCAVSFFALAATTAQADIIVDLAVESNTGWQTNGWYSPTGGYFSQDTGPLTEGGMSTHSNNSATYHNDLSFGNYTIQEGTYTISFAVGNFNNEPLPTMAISFAGMDINLADSSSTPAPAAGNWELYSYTWDVTAGSGFIGNALNFYSSASGFGNVSLDGVGQMSNLGNGFLVDYSNGASVDVPEPSTLAIFALGLLGLTARRAKK